MRFKINETDFEVSHGIVATYNLEAGEMVFTFSQPELLRLSGPRQIKQLETAPSKNERGSEGAIGKVAIRNRTMKLLQESEDGRITGQALTINLLGNRSAPSEKVFLKRVLSDLVSDGLLATEKVNDRIVYMLRT